MNLKRFVAAPCLTLLIIGGTSWAETFDIDVAHSHVGFKIRHMISKANGQFTQFSGTVEFDDTRKAPLKTIAIIETASINTNSVDRDKHLRGKDFFNVEKFPFMKFTSKTSIAKSSTEFTLHGDLTLLGVTKPVSLDVTYGGRATDPMQAERIGFSAKGKINRKDFGMTYNAPMDKANLMLGEEVEILIDIEAVKQK